MFIFKKNFLSFFFFLEEAKAITMCQTAVCNKDGVEGFVLKTGQNYTKIFQIVILVSWHFCSRCHRENQFPNFL